MKKYYGYFVYDGEEYVARFKIDGSLQWNAKAGCFEDKDWYVRSAADVIALAVFDSNPSNLRNHFSCGFLLSHKDFVNERARGVKRWRYPQNEVIKWD